MEFAFWCWTLKGKESLIGRGEGSRFQGFQGFQVPGVPDSRNQQLRTNIQKPTTNNRQLGIFAPYWYWMHDEPGYEKRITVNEATVTLRKDGIVHVLFQRRILLDVPLQMLLLNIYLEITDRKKHPFLFEGMSGIRVTAEARENALRIEEEAPGCAYAVVAPTLAYQLIANFYLNVRKPKSPYRVFRDREAAVQWLKTFVRPQ
jgi:hypothetical protein